MPLHSVLLLHMKYFEVYFFTILEAIGQSFYISQEKSNKNTKVRQFPSFVYLEDIIHNSSDIT